MWLYQPRCFVERQGPQLQPQPRRREQNLGLQHNLVSLRTFSAASPVLARLDSLSISRHDTEAQGRRLLWPSNQPVGAA